MYQLPRLGRTRKRNLEKKNGVIHRKGPGEDLEVKEK